MKRQEQLKPSGQDDQHYGMDEMKEQTTVVNMVPELTLVMEGDRKDSQAMGGSRELVVDRAGSTEGGLRLAPNIKKKIAELRRVVVGGSTEKKKRGRARKKLPELPKCFPRIDVIISAMGGKKIKRKRDAKDDDEDNILPKRRQQGF